MIYVKEVGSTRPFVADETLPGIQARFDRGELEVIPTVTPADAQRGIVTPEQVLAGKVVVTDGEELKPPVTHAPASTVEAAALDRENQARNRAYSESKERVNGQRQDAVDLESVGPGAGKLMTVDQFLASGRPGYIRKSALTGYHNVDLQLIISGRVRVVDD